MLVALAALNKALRSVDASAFVINTIAGAIIVIPTATLETSQRDLVQYQNLTALPAGRR